jgi:hypothetical protein
MILRHKALQRRVLKLSSMPEGDPARSVADRLGGARIGGADVIFGEEGDSTLLGALTLEALGLALDPLRRELKPLPMLLACSPARGTGVPPVPSR